MTTRPSTDGNDCKDEYYCDWLYDGGDADTGIEAAWICQHCGAVDVHRDPPEDFDEPMDYAMQYALGSM